MYTYGYLFYVPITILVSVLFIVNGIVGKRPLAYYLLSLLAIIYINKAIELAIFPFVIADLPEVSIYNNINLSINLSHLSRVQLIGNVLLTVPIGVGIQYFINTKFMERLVLSILLALSFEFVQLILLLTLKPIDIFFDMNDIICNGMGAVIGLFIAYLMNQVLCKLPIKSNQGLLSYVHQVALNCSKNQKSLDNLNDLKQSKKLLNS